MTAHPIAAAPMTPTTPATTRTALRHHHLPPDHHANIQRLRAAVGEHDATRIRNQRGQDLGVGEIYGVSSGSDDEVLAGGQAAKPVLAVAARSNDLRSPRCRAGPAPKNSIDREHRNQRVGGGAAVTVADRAGRDRDPIDSVTTRLRTPSGANSMAVSAASVVPSIADFRIQPAGSPPTLIR